MPHKAILCVDDEKSVLDTLKDQMKRRLGQEYHYESAESADEAWEVIDEFNNDKIKILIIVSDWLMPGMKGDEFLEQVHQKFPDIVTMLLTGQADDAAIQRAREKANLYHCLHKPWNENELIETIQSAWNSHEKTADPLR